MSGNDDFFGGSLTPPVAPSGQPSGGFNSPPPINKEYGSYGGPTPTSTKAATPLMPLVVGAVVLVVVALIAFVGYRYLFGGTQIELPNQLMGMERIDPDSAQGKALEQSFSQLNEDLDRGVEVHVGGYQANGRLLVVAAAEDGTTNPNDVKQFFDNGVTTLLAEVPSAKVTDADPGPGGGKMKCFEMTYAATKSGVCVWLAEDDLGAVVASPLESDVAQMARTVRAEITK